MRRTVLLVLLLAGCGWSGVLAARARTIWDGVNSEAQAKRGETLYRQNCALCHGVTLGGTENAPELAGEPFLKSWYGKSVNDLVKQVQKSMPKDDPGILPAQKVVDVLAHVFSVNKFPVGSDDLVTTADVLSDIRIERQHK